MLNKVQVKRLMEAYLEEDWNMPYDWTTLSPLCSQPASYSIIAKQSGVMCGGPFIKCIFVDILDCQLSLPFEEASPFPSNTSIASIHGPIGRVLLGERVALSILTRTCGIAQKCQRMKSLLEKCDWKERIAGTRKLTPGFRLCEKYALWTGGVDPHRYGLGDVCMLKDTFVDLLGPTELFPQVNSMRHKLPFACNLEVEASDKASAASAAEAGANIVMLDNMPYQEVTAVSEYIKRRHPHVLVEASGGITEENVLDYAVSTVDIISMGSLTMRAPRLDFSMKLQSERCSTA